MFLDFHSFYATGRSPTTYLALSGLASGMAFLYIRIILGALVSAFPFCTECIVVLCNLCFGRGERKRRGD